MSVLTIPDLRIEIDNLIKANGLGEITGPILNGVLQNITDSLEDIAVHTIGHLIQEEGVSLTARLKLNFVGPSVTVTDNGSDTTIVTITDSQGHVIQEEGSPLATRLNLNFIGPSVTVTDDAGNNATLVTITDSEGHIIQEEGVSLTTREKLNFVGASVTVTDNGSDTTIVTITDSQGHVVQEDGVSTTQRSKLDFIGIDVSVSDNAGLDKTIVNIGDILVQQVNTYYNGAETATLIDTSVVTQPEGLIKSVLINPAGEQNKTTYIWRLDGRADHWLVDKGNTGGDVRRHVPVYNGIIETQIDIINVTIIP